MFRVFQIQIADGIVDGIPMLHLAARQAACGQVWRAQAIVHKDPSRAHHRRSLEAAFLHFWRMVVWAPGQAGLD